MKKTIKKLDQQSIQNTKAVKGGGGKIKKIRIRPTIY